MCLCVLHMHARTRTCACAHTHTRARAHAHTRARTRTHAHNNFIQQGIRETYDSLLDPYNSMRTMSCTNTPNLHIFNWIAQ